MSELANEAIAEFSPPVVRPDSDTRLDQLVAEYELTKPLADEYTAKLKGIVDGIKAELVERHPEQREIVLVGTTATNPLRLEAVQRWQLDTKKLKSERPELYVSYAYQATSWRLCQMKQA
jgi:hypothetical protein